MKFIFSGIQVKDEDQAIESNRTHIFRTLPHSIFCSRNYVNK
ncbi:hypothetical protein HanXRQr2_Chr06g0251621 [Helianthus annuus]|uniref:Uncharacterized protein n=1 Tax=Helianthus annuus TaxID=4232 RepID=A0A9K3ITG9_HELAN|nr:hypothetical protein HanXRQr2_Chr06g0251621 [Helianthus annuus]